MKTFKSKKKNNKGFTLIELLAVIVVLAIIMVIAMTTVLPYASEARKRAFAVEVNGAIQAASEEMTMIAIGTHKHNESPLENGVDYYRNDGATKYCFTMKKLVQLGFLSKSQKAINNGDYAGYVVVTAAAGTNYYTYTVKMHNSQYQVNATSDEVAATDISSYVLNDTDTASFQCSADLVK